MKRKRSIIFSACLFCSVIGLFAQDVPNAVKFLPSPPQQGSSVQYVNDFLQYAWGKDQRTTSRGYQAIDDLPLTATTYASAFSSIIGLEITEKSTPKLYTLYDYALRMSEMAAETPQNYYNTERPYVSFSEHTLLPTYENTYRNVGSFPCVQATAGWLSGLITAEVVPAVQNEALARGYAFGVSAIISGYNWYTDVTAGRHLGSALLAYFHSQNSFTAMITEARNEYKSKGGAYARQTRADEGDEEEEEEEEEPSGPSVVPYIQLEELPDGLLYLPGPPTHSSSIFGYDFSQHMEGKILRPYSDGKQAVEDVTYSVDNWCSIYGPLFGATISESATPQLYELLTRVHPSANAATQSAKAGYMRLRPYVFLNETTAYPADEDELRETGSYPSGHASGSWLVAMILAEINPSSQDALFARAYQFGQGRVITGYHWQSDVDDGRLVASAVFARLHADEGFMAQLTRAKAEFNGSTRISTPEATSQSEAPVYNLQGIRVEGAPTHHGIYIQGNQKVAR
ncbi:MAG: phosphatase PAP2 family protein [Prevotella sp.]|nr:phosphatase PAP2 family protein [Prevotella sp.]